MLSALDVDMETVNPATPALESKQRRQLASDRSNTRTNHVRVLDTDTL